MRVTRFKVLGWKLTLVLQMLCVLSASPLVAASFEGQKMPPLELNGDEGERTDGSPWSSSEISGKTFMLLYVDPDEQQLNDEMANAVKAQNFPRDKFQSVVVINMAATWKPNAIIGSILKKRQEEFPQTTYVKDFKKVLVDKWKFKDDSYDVAVFDPAGTVLFYRSGKMSPEEIQQMIGIIANQIKLAQSPVAAPPAAAPEPAAATEAAPAASQRTKHRGKTNKPAQKSKKEQSK